MVVDVPEIDLGLGSQHCAGPIGQDAQGVALRGKVPPQGQNQALDGKDLAECVLVELGEDSLLEAVHEVVELVDDREIGINGLVDNGVH